MQKMPGKPVPGSAQQAVSVLVERRLSSNGRWSQYQWQCVSVLACREMAAEQGGCTLVNEDPETATSRYIWSGLNIELFKDGCESYWYNLLSEIPYLFVICFHDDMNDDDDPRALQPVLVTPNQDEANAHMESEDQVFSIPMPDHIVEWVEAYVMDHYDPVIKKKRKRRDWAKESEQSAKQRHSDRQLH